MWQMGCRIPILPLATLNYSIKVCRHSTSLVFTQSTFFRNSKLGFKQTQSVRRQWSKVGVLHSSLAGLFDTARSIHGNQFLPCQLFLINEANSTTEGSGRRSLALKVFAPSFTLSHTDTLSTFCCPVAFALNDQAQHSFAVKKHSFINMYSLFTSRLKFMREGKKRF